MLPRTPWRLGSAGTGVRSPPGTTPLTWDFTPPTLGSSAGTALEFTSRPAEPTTGKTGATRGAVTVGTGASVAGLVIAAAEGGGETRRGGSVLVGATAGTGAVTLEVDATVWRAEPEVGTAAVFTALAATWRRVPAICGATDFALPAGAEVAGTTAAEAEAADAAEGAGVAVVAEEAEVEVVDAVAGAIGVATEGAEEAVVTAVVAEVADDEEVAEEEAAVAEVPEEAVVVELVEADAAAAFLSDFAATAVASVVTVEVVEVSVPTVPVSESAEANPRHRTSRRTVPATTMAKRTTQRRAPGAPTDARDSPAALS